LCVLHDPILHLSHMGSSGGCSGVVDPVSSSCCLLRFRNSSSTWSNVQKQKLKENIPFSSIWRGTIQSISN